MLGPSTSRSPLHTTRSRLAPSMISGKGSGLVTGGPVKSDSAEALLRGLAYRVVPEGLVTDRSRKRPSSPGYSRKPTVPVVRAGIPEGRLLVLMTESWRPSRLTVIVGPDRAGCTWCQVP